MGRAIGLGVALVCALGVSGGAPISAQPPSALSPDALAALKFRYVGPVGNRVTAIEGVTGHPYVYYVGAASGGIWKTTDDGIHWEPIFDGSRMSVDRRARRRARRDPNIVWAGTGEAFIRSNISIGNGVYKSHRRREDVVAHGPRGHRSHRAHRRRSDEPGHRVRRGASATPTDRSRSAASTARPTAARRGSACSFVDENTGGVDVVMDPNNPRMLFAGDVAARDPDLGPRERWTGQRHRSSRSTAAATWQRLSGHGLPKLPLGKIGARDRAQQFEPRLRADRNRRRRADPRAADASGRCGGRRRRRHLEGGELRPRACVAGRTITRAWRSRPTTTTRPTSSPRVHADGRRRRRRTASI